MNLQIGITMVETAQCTDSVVILIENPEMTVKRTLFNPIRTNSIIILNFVVARVPLASAVAVK